MKRARITYFENAVYTPLEHNEKLRCLVLYIYMYINKYVFASLQMKIDWKAAL